MLSIDCNGETVGVEVRIEGHEYGWRKKRKLNKFEEKEMMIAIIIKSNSPLHFVRLLFQPSDPDDGRRGHQSPVIASVARSRVIKDLHSKEPSVTKVNSAGGYGSCCCCCCPSVSPC